MLAGISNAKTLTQDDKLRKIPIVKIVKLCDENSPQSATEKAAPRGAAIRCQEIEDICNKSPLSEDVGNKCLYKCLICEVVYATWSKFREHSLKMHLETWTVAMMGKVIVKSVAHQCKICGKKQLCDSRFLRAHLANSHQMKLEDYLKGEKCQRFVHVPVHHNERGNFLFKAETTPVVGNMCKFSCKKCELKFDSCKSLNYHLSATKHGKSMYGVFNLYEEGYLDHVVTHVCLICSKRVLCDYLMLRSHFKKRHNVTTMEEYCKRTGAPMRETAKKALLVRDSEEVSANMRDRCTFACPKCTEQFDSTRKLTSHLRKTNHAVPKNGISYQCLVKKVMYRCGLCEKMLLSDHDLIRSHLKAKHKMSVTKYKNHMECLKETLEDME